jgi:hypothetical protein
MNNPVLILLALWAATSLATAVTAAMPSRRAHDVLRAAGGRRCYLA